MSDQVISERRHADRRLGHRHDVGHLDAKISAHTAAAAERIDALEDRLAEVEHALGEMRDLVLRVSTPAT
jgi:hypothetical protein